MGAGVIWPLADRLLVAAFDPKLPLAAEPHRRSDRVAMHSDANKPEGWNHSVFRQEDGQKDNVDALVFGGEQPDEGNEIDGVIRQSEGRSHERGASKYHRYDGNDIAEH